MKATVIKEFGDKENNDRLYLPGNEFEAAEKRVADLEVKGYVKRVEAEKAAPKKTTRKRTTKE